ncbi:MAG: hypothetical protein JNJ52_07130 [Flavobacterium sp.]|nr:hypothetical protein [Flavobacterium sp.]
MIKVQKIAVFVLIVFLSLCYACSSSDEEYIEVSPVVMDLTVVPYPKLSDYKFFEGELKNLNPSYGVIPYKPASELFSEYALKKRFIWMPNGTKASYTSDGEILNLPVGAALIKVFYYDNVQPNNTTQIIETRIMIRKSDGWVFAEYIWNTQQTDAFLETAQTNRTISWKDENNVIQTVDYRTPIVDADCFRCHGNITTLQKIPIGIKPQNLNTNYTYSEGSKNQLSKLIEFGYLENNLPSTIVSTVNYKDASNSIDHRVRSYFDANCAHCHINDGEAAHLSLRFAFNETTNPVMMGVGVNAEHFVPGYTGRIVQPNNVAQSILHYRVNTHTDNFYIMPPLGRTIKHTEGVQLIEDWINSL